MPKPSLHDYEWAHEIYDDLLRYRTALEKIANWELPKTNQYWSNGLEMGYEYLYGSNGAKDHIRSVAQKALDNKSVP